MWHYQKLSWLSRSRSWVNNLEAPWLSNKNLRTKNLANCIKPIILIPINFIEYIENIDKVGY